MNEINNTNINLEFKKKQLIICEYIRHTLLLKKGMGRERGYTNPVCEGILDNVEEKVKNEYKTKSIFNLHNIMDDNDLFFFRPAGGGII